MKLSHIVTADTRTGWLADSCKIGEYGKVNLEGCRSVDFITEATIARQRFLESPLVDEVETIICIDVHEPIPSWVYERLFEISNCYVVTDQHDRHRHRWNDYIYIHALRQATGDLVAKWDGDCIGYRHPDFDVLTYYFDFLSNGAAYVCQQTKLIPEVEPMWWASTRFFLCRRETLDLDEAARCIDDDYRRAKYGPKHCPCLEHCLGLMCGERVIYPPEKNSDFIVWNWVQYYLNCIPKLNNMPYADILQYVHDCGDVHGASDLIGIPL